MDARQQHAQTAPAFASRDACEAKFGLENCAETRQRPSADQIQPGEQQAAAQSGGGSWFMPAMLGYMMGRTLGGGGAFVPPSRGRPGAGADGDDGQAGLPRRQQHGL